MIVLIADPNLRHYADAEPRDEDALYRAAVAQRLLDERATLLKSLEARGVITLDVPAEQLTVALLDRYLQIKARGAL
jgi:uncharacterized protein (DUF58 family)